VRSRFFVGETSRGQLQQRFGESECLTISLVRLSYSLSWCDFDIDKRPETVIVESDATRARLDIGEGIPIE
jgi:hypothetical protein